MEGNKGKKLARYEQGRARREGSLYSAESRRNEELFCK